MRLCGIRRERRLVATRRLYIAEGCLNIALFVRLHMENHGLKDRAYTRQLRIFLEEICAELCRFQHVSGEGLAPEDVLIKREASLGVPGVFFDITVRLPDRQPYFVEVKFGYPREFLITHLSKKFGPDIAETAEAERLVVLVRTADYSNWAEIESELRSALRPNLQLDIWDETHLLQLIHECFGVKIDTITGDDLISVRRAIDDSKWRYAFGDTHADHYLAGTLLWHFGFWTLHRLYKEQGIQPHDLEALAAKLPTTRMPDGRSVRLQPMAVDLEDAADEFSFPPRFGEHTDAILAEAGHSADDIAALRENGVI